MTAAGRRAQGSARGPRALGRALLLAALLLLPSGYLLARCGTSSEANAPSADAYADPELPGVASADAAIMAELERARVAKGADYEPRTMHLLPDGAPRYTNRLIREASPYLLQHAHNPVNWYPWGAEAFERARVQGKPVLLSVGYSTCHWCHVMERESFEDEEIARYLNEHFVAIKVDREERPDVDATYMEAVRSLTGRGGWPMTAALTSDRQPFFGGTYFPARDGDRGARKGFLTILGELSTRYAQDRAGAVAEARQVSDRLRKSAEPAPRGEVPGADAIARAAGSLIGAFDPEWGGFGGAPKFPMPVNLELLMRYERRAGDARARAVVEGTLEKMANGGLYDQLGGGFHRYSVDRSWTVPHFEKMLYDNAQLAVVYLEAYQLTGRLDFARVGAETLEYVAREMTDAAGGFHSATDADSATPDGGTEEGYFFTWTPAEIGTVLGSPRAEVASRYWGVSAAGHVDGRSVLHIGRQLDETAHDLGIDQMFLQAELGRARAELFAQRARRPPPLRDDKILASWNGLMITAFARGAFVLDRPDFGDLAAAAAHFVLDNMRAEDGTLRRSYRGGAGEHAFLDDYAFVIQGLLDLFAVSQDLVWLESAIALQSIQDHSYAHEGGGYFMTATGHDDALARARPIDDGVEPSGNSVAMLNLLRLAELTSDDSYRSKAEAGFSAFGPAVARGSGRHAKLLTALDFLHGEPLEILIVEAASGSGSAELLDKLRRSYLPNHVMVIAHDSTIASVSQSIPMLEGKRALSGKTTAYVCTRGYCKLPTSDPGVFAGLLASPRKP